MSLFLPSIIKELKMMAFRHKLRPFSAYSYTFGPSYGRPKDIVLSLRHPGYMNYGDTLFYVPLAHILTRLGYAVYVDASPDMWFLFRGTGARALEQVSADSLVITRDICALDAYQRYGFARALVLNTSSRGINRPIGSAIVDAVLQYLQLPHVEIALEDFPFLQAVTQGKSLEVFEQLTGQNTGDFCVYAPYIGSGRARLWPSDKRYLRNVVSSDGYTGILIGSAKDKSNDHYHYEGFVDVRGKTDPESTVYLLNSPLIRTVYSHDTYIMHIAHLLNKSSLVVFRRFYKLGESQQKRKAFHRIFNAQVLSGAIIR